MHLLLHRLIEQVFQFADLFLFANIRWGCYEKLGLLSCRANAESSFYPYRLQVRRLAAASKISEVFKYKFVFKSKFSKSLVAKHISMLTEVNPLAVFHSSRGRFIVLKITELSDIYHSCQCQKIFK